MPAAHRIATRAHRLNATTSRLERPATSKRRYKVIAVGLYEDQVLQLDDLAARLRAGGFAQANRSSVLQMILHQLQQKEIELPGLLALFASDVRRPLAVSPPRPGVLPERISTPSRSRKPADR